MRLRRPWHKNSDLLIVDNDQQQSEDNKPSNVCTAEDCYILNRSDRDKSCYRERNGDLARLFFVNSKGNDTNIVDDEDLLKSICCQEVMDTIHCFIHHTIRINPKEIKYKELKEKENKSNGVDDDFFDSYTDTICSIIESKEKSLRFRRNGTRYKTGNKFISTNNFLNSEDTSKGNTKQSIDNMCFIDALKTELKEAMIAASFTTVNIDILNHFNTIIETEEFDSDAVNYDFKTQSTKSGIINELKSKISSQTGSVGIDGLNDYINLIQEICYKFVSRTGLSKDTYSFGWRYFYWLYYQNMKEEENILWKNNYNSHKTESNPGYQICEWYIPAKYQTLKDESLNNNCCIMSIYQYNNIHNKAMLKLSQWNKSQEVRKLTCNDSCWNKFYGIKGGSSILLEHIIALLKYTNFTRECFEFSRTYRKIHPFESDRDLKKRHSEVAVWGKRLRELIECFGNVASKYKHISKFYHGINSSMIFKSTTAKFSGPVSTTMGMYTKYIYFVFQISDCVL